MYARSKGFDPAGWVVLSIFIGPFTLLFLAIATRDPNRVCPLCKGVVPEGAVKCRHCGADLDI